MSERDYILAGNYQLLDALYERLRIAELRISTLENALENFAVCNLTEDNCDSFDTANRRIRNIANRALRDSEALKD